jgi:glycosyltransferase involved in cell wall biosynthesis
MNIGFLSTRLSGIDGVSLETAKLATICRRLGHQAFYCAGELDGPGDSPACDKLGTSSTTAQPAMLVPEMHFAHPEAAWIYDHCFGCERPAPDLERRIQEMAGRLRAAVERFVTNFKIDLLFVQNALAIPMHVPLAVALTDLIQATGIATLAHHHDLAWERERFAITCIPDIVARCFPPALPPVQHLVINSPAQRALRQRKGIEATLLPNIFDYARPAPALSERSADLRSRLGLSDDHLLILQPTRVIPRKGIELAIEFVRRLRMPRWQARLAGKTALLVISHPAGDEGTAYLHRLQDLAQAVDVPLIYAAGLFAAEAGEHAGRRVYSLWDAYVRADFVTYPSLIEGFGNALLETLYFRLPALVNRYDVYAADIGPKGFDLIEIDAEGDPENLAAVGDDAVEAAIEVIFDPVCRSRTVELNYRLATEHYSFEAVTPALARLLERAIDRGRLSPGATELGGPSSLQEV